MACPNYSGRKREGAHALSRFHGLCHAVTLESVWFVRSTLPLCKKKNEELREDEMVPARSQYVVEFAATVVVCCQSSRA